MWTDGSKKILVLTAVVIMGATAFAGCFGPPPPPPPPPVNIPPFANPTVSTTLAQAGDTVSFTATGADLDGSITAWRWTFGDGTNASGQNVTHAYAHQGTYYSTLNVTDNSGGSYDSIVTGTPLRVVVLPNFPASTPEDQPLATLTLWNISSVVQPGTTLSWSAKGSYGSWNSEASHPGTIVTYRIDYNDGSSMATESHTNTSLADGTWNGNFTHQFTAAGVYAVMLTVTTNTSKNDITVWTVVVYSTAVTPNVKNPKTLVIETFGQPEFLDPAVAYDDASGQILQAVYETLITYDGSHVDQFIPALAESLPTIANGGITNNNMTYTFHLRHNVKFHSGHNLTAADVVYSIQRVIDIDDPGGPAWILTQVLNNTSVAKGMDDYTVVFTLTRPYGAFLSLLAYTVAAVVSKDTVEANGGVVYHTQNTYLNTHTDGTGPFIFKSWVNGQQIVLDRNPNYWDTVHAAKLDHIIIRFVTEFSTRLLELRSGDADIITVPGSQRPAIQALAATTSEQIKVQSGASTWVIGTGVFNYNINVSQRGDIGTVPSPDNVPSDFFQDLNMRKAFSLAFDYNDYITNVAKGLAFRLAGIIPRGMYGYNASMPVPTYDIDGAKAAYNQTAWVTNSTYNPAGYAGGFNLTLGYNSGNTARQKALENVKRGVESFGPNIHINVVGFEWSVYLGLTLHTPSGQPGALGMFYIGWGPDYADPDDYIVPFCKSGGTYPAFTGYSNATVDAWIDQAGSIPNGPDRLALYDQIQLSVVNDYVYLLNVEAMNFHVSKTWVQGWYFNPMLSGNDLGGNMAGLSKS